MLETAKQLEKAFLICTTIPKSASSKSIRRKTHREHLDELEFLAQTAGADIAGKFYQERDFIDPAFFIGKGKAEEISRLTEENKIEVVIFENQLSPTQIRNLEKIFKCKVIDKPALILDIFARNARTAEAKTQVELAQLQYLLPRLTRQWTHLSKQYGGIGTKGPGETQIETDRRLVKTRLSVLKEKLKKIEEQRKTQRQLRRNFIRVALVGYTNTGKSTLLNTLTGAGVYVENKLFATLDTSTRQLTQINDKKFNIPVLISDTVGFIRNLPHDLVESFKSTLAEVVESDILLHLVDISSESYQEQIKVVNETLAELNVHSHKVIMVFNKTDLLPLPEKEEVLLHLRNLFPEAVFISAKKGLNLRGLEIKLTEAINEEMNITDFRIPSDIPQVYKLLNTIHNFAEITETKFLKRSIKLRVRANKHYIEKINRMISHYKKHGKQGTQL
jgi:GTP-binding protein HflX